MVLINERRDIDNDPRICVPGAGHGGGDGWPFSDGWI